MAPNGRRKHATLYDFRDLDLMLRLANEGGLLSEDLAKALGFGKDVLPIAQRMTWMRRFGMVDRDNEGFWELTPGGTRVVKAKLKAAQANALEALPEEALVDAMAAVVSRHPRDPMLAAMLRREFAYGTRRR